MDCYFHILKSLVGDDLKFHGVCEPYVRDEKPYCCGAKLKTLDGILACPSCTSEYEEKDFKL